MKTPIEQFLSTELRNSWLNVGPMNVYVRKRLANICDSKSMTHIVIANVSVEEGYQNKGVFTHFLEEVEATGENVYIENILTKRFTRFFEKRGYSIHYIENTASAELIQKPC